MKGARKCTESITTRSGFPWVGVGLFLGSKKRWVFFCLVPDKKTHILIFVLKKDRKLDEEEKERGRFRGRRLLAANPKSLFETLLNLVTLQPRVKRVNRIHHRRRMVRWCIRLTRFTLVREVIVIRYCLVQVRQNLKNKPMLPFGTIHDSAGQVPGHSGWQGYESSSKHVKVGKFTNNCNRNAL